MTPIPVPRGHDACESVERWLLDHLRGGQVAVTYASLTAISGAPHRAVAQIVRELVNSGQWELVKPAEHEQGVWTPDALVLRSRYHVPPPHQPHPPIHSARAGVAPVTAVFDFTDLA